MPVVKIGDAAVSEEILEGTPVVVDCVKLVAPTVTVPPRDKLDPPPAEFDRDAVEIGLGPVPFGCFELNVGTEVGCVPVFEKVVGPSNKNQHQFH